MDPLSYPFPTFNVDSTTYSGHYPNSDYWNWVNYYYQNGFSHDQPATSGYSFMTSLSTSTLSAPSTSSGSDSTLLSMTPPMPTSTFTTPNTSSTLSSTATPCPMLSMTHPFYPMLPTSTMTPPITTATPHRPQGPLKQCSNCFATETCQWRNVRLENGIQCNACFIYQRKYKKTRPVTAMEKYRNCTQIQDSQIYEGNEIHIPGGDGDLQSIPANFHCVYRISVPQDSFYKLYASVELKNGIRGVNDYIVVTEENGNAIRMNNKTGIGGKPYRYIVNTGGEMKIEVVTKSLFMNTKMAISVYYRAYCNQLVDSDISDGETNFIPGNSSQPIPANYSCTYTISAPTNPTTGLYADVTLISNMNGFQDKIIVTDITGANDWDPDISYYNYIVIPGSSMSFQIETGYLFMASMFMIKVEWHEVTIGPTKPMIRDEINYVDLGLLKDDTSVFNSVTFSANEQLVVSQVYYTSVLIDFPNCFVIDGNITDQKKIITFKNFNYFYYESESNYMTFVMFNKGVNAYVLNLLSVAIEYNYPFAAASNPGLSFYMNSSDHNPGQKTALEIINFKSIGNKITDLVIQSENCKAYVVSGSPANSNILLDLSTAVIPHYLDVNNLSVVAEDCAFTMDIEAFDGGVLELK